MDTAFKYNRLDNNNAACLLVDHQNGSTNCVQDFSPDDFENNLLALADCAKYFNLPTIPTSFEDVPNGRPGRPQPSDNGCGRGEARAL